MGIKWYFIMVLKLFLMINNAEYFFLGLIDCVSSLEKCLSLLIFKLGYLSFVLSYKNCLYMSTIPLSII